MRATPTQPTRGILRCHQALYLSVRSVSRTLCASCSLHRRFRKSSSEAGRLSLSFRPTKKVTTIGAFPIFGNHCFDHLICLMPENHIAALVTDLMRNVRDSDNLPVCRRRPVSPNFRLITPPHAFKTWRLLRMRTRRGTGSAGIVSLGFHRFSSEFSVFIFFLPCDVN